MLTKSLETAKTNAAGRSLWTRAYQGGNDASAPRWGQIHGMVLHPSLD